MTFSAEFPGNVTTKAYADGLSVDQLYYAVYNTGETNPVYVPQEPVEITGKSANVHLKLVSGKTYDILFWAQDADNKTYRLALDGQTITVDYAQMKSNDETNDAFYAFRTYEVKGAVNEIVGLTRPFAQINLGTNDLAGINDDSFNLTKSSMKATVANVLNLATGAVSGEAEVEYAANLLPVESKDGSFPVGGYSYLAMNYVLIGKDDATTNCEFAIYEGENTTATNTITVSNVPVKRNYRTNIYGSLITDQAGFIVQVEPGIGNLSNVEVTEVPKLDEFLEVVKNGGKASLTSDIIVTKENGSLTSLTIENGKVVNMDLNGHTLACEKIVMKDNSELSINNGNLSVNHLISEGGIRYGGKESVKITLDGVNFVDETSMFGAIFIDSNNSDANKVIIRNSSIMVTNSYGLGAITVTGKTELIVENSEIVNSEDYGYSVMMTEVNGGGTSSPSTISITGSELTGGVYCVASDASLENFVVNIDDCTITCDQVSAVTASNADVTVTNSTLESKNATQGYEEEEYFCGYAIALLNCEETDTEYDGSLTAENNTYKVAAENGSPVYYYGVGAGDGDWYYRAEDKTFLVMNAAGLKWVADVCNGVVESDLVGGFGNKGPFEEQTVKLMNNIDLSDVEWTPIAKSGNVYFAGTFDGNNKTISGLTVNTTGDNHAGLFAKMSGLVKDLTLTDVNVSGEYFAGALVAYCYGDVDNCHVIGGSVSSTHASEHVGGLVGYLCDPNHKVTNSSAKNLTVTGTVHVGGLVGAANVSAIVENNTVESVTVVGNQTGITIDEYGSQVNEVVGWNVLNSSTVRNNTTSNNTVKITADGITVINDVAEISKAAGMSWANQNLFAKSGYSYTLTDNIDMQGIEWTSNILDKNVVFTFDGNGKTISNWNTAERALLAIKNNSDMTVKNLTLSDCHVNNTTAGGSDGVGLLIGFAEMQDNITIEGVNVNNCTLASKANWSGALIGYNSQADNLVVKNCVVNGVRINGDGSVGGIIGHDAGAMSTISGCTVSGCEFATTEAGDWRVGAIAGTVGAGESAYSAYTIAADNTYTQTAGASDAAKIYGDEYSNVFGRFTQGDGILYLNGERVWLVKSGENYYASIAAAVAAGNTRIELAKGTFKMPAAKGKTLTFVGAGQAEDVVITIRPDGDSEADNTLSQSTVTFENLTLEANPAQTQYSGFGGCNLTAKKCIIENTYNMYGKSAFEGCTFNVKGDRYNV